MNKILLSCMCILLFSCSKIDNSIDKNYIQNFNDIKKNNPQYSEKDYNRAIATATELYGEASLSDQDPEGITISITYKELLENAKRNNLNDSVKWVRIEKLKSTLNKILTVSILKFEYTPDLFDDRNLYDRQSGIKLDLNMNNNSTKEIVKIVGILKIKNMNNKTLFDFPINQELSILPKSAINFFDKNIVNIDENNNSLQSATIDSLHLEWMPSYIKFKDGKEISLIKN